MALLSLGIGCCLVILILTKIIASLARRRRYHVKAARQGCEAAPLVPKKGFLGLTRVRDNLTAIREERGPQLYVEALNEVGTSEDIHTARFEVLGSDFVVTRDPENVKAIFVTHASDFEISTTRIQSFKPLMGSGILTLRGDPWRHSRSLLRPQFARDQISDIELEERHLDALSAGLKTGPDGWTDVVDLQPMFFKMTLELMTEFLYGHAPSQPGKISNAPDRKEFEYHFDKGKGYVNTRIALVKWYWLVHPPAFSRHCEKVHQYADYFVKAKLEQKRRESARKQMPQDIETTGKFVLLDELAKSTNDPLEIRHATLGVYSAGRDTTASLLSWVFYFLSRYPQVFQQLRSTVLAEFGTEASSIDFPKLRSCQYLQHCINEALRMVPVIPTQERVSLEDVVLPRGGGSDGSKPIFVEKGGRVLISIYALHQRKDIWGNDPEVFKPERWAGRRAGMEFIPFGGGPRKCVGQQMALTEASYTVVRLLQRFDGLQNCELPGRIRLQHKIAIRSGTGVVVRFHEAKSG